MGPKVTGMSRSELGFWAGKQIGPEQIGPELQKIAIAFDEDMLVVQSIKVELTQFEKRHEETLV